MHGIKSIDGECAASLCLRSVFLPGKVRLHLVQQNGLDVADMLIDVGALEFLVEGSVGFVEDRSMGGLGIGISIDLMIVKCSRSRCFDRVVVLFNRHGDG